MRDLIGSGDRLRQPPHAQIRSSPPKLHLLEPVDHIALHLTRAVHELNLLPGLRGPVLRKDEVLRRDHRKTFLGLPEQPANARPIEILPDEAAVPIRHWLIRVAGAEAVIHLRLIPFDLQGLCAEWSCQRQRAENEPCELHASADHRARRRKIKSGAQHRPGRGDIARDLRLQRLDP